jgi:3,4-dihydroxy 2-butanone 4-phosphate synthase/GTP cyclohydrolase II
MNEDGTMARVPQLVEFCKRYGLKMISVADLIRYRMQNERFVELDGEGQIRTRFGEFKVQRFVSRIDNEIHLALVRGEVSGKQNVLVRVHSHCVYGDVLHSIECDCHQSIASALRQIARAGSGVFVYLHQTGAGLQVAWQEGKHQIIGHSRAQSSLIPADRHQPPLQHEIGLGAQILSALGLSTIHLLTNHPRKVVGLEGFGIQIRRQIPLPLAVEAEQADTPVNAGTF